MHESDTRKWAQIQGYPIVPKNLCGFAENRCRHEMRNSLRSGRRLTRTGDSNIFKSMTHVVPSHLLDRSLWDFHEFHALTQPPKP